MTFDFLQNCRSQKSFNFLTPAEKYGALLRSFMTTSILSNDLYYIFVCDINFYFLSVYFISIKPVLSDHLSYVTIFDCSLGRSRKTSFDCKNKNVIVQ